MALLLPARTSPGRCRLGDIAAGEVQTWFSVPVVFDGFGEPTKDCGPGGAMNGMFTVG